MLKYHDLPEKEMPGYETFMEIYSKREGMWEELLAEVDRTIRCEWTSEQIEDVLRSIQEYCGLDIPEKRFSPKNLAIVVDQVCRVAIAMTVHGVPEKDRQYISSRLYRALWEITDPN